MPRADKVAAVRAIIAALSAALPLTTTTRAVAAQDVASTPRWEFLVSSGRTVPGLGAGGRSYNSRSVGVRPTHSLAAYGSAGGELGLGRVRLRVEARDYLTGFTTAARNDVAVMVGMRFNAR